MPRSRSVARSQTELKMEEIARWQLLDKPIDDIADKMGMTPDAISEIVKHPAYREIRSRLLGNIYEPVDMVIKERKADAMLHEAAPDAAEALITLLNSKRTVEVPTEDGIKMVEVPLDPVDIRLTATAILDRSGYGPIQRKHVRQRLEMDPMLVKMFSAAMKESDVRTIDAEIIEEGGEVPAQEDEQGEAEGLLDEPDQSDPEDGETGKGDGAGSSVGGA